MGESGGRRKCGTRARQSREVLFSSEGSRRGLDFPVKHEHPRHRFGAKRNLLQRSPPTPLGARPSPRARSNALGRARARLTGDNQVDAAPGAKGMVWHDHANRTRHGARRERACGARTRHGQAGVSALVRLPIVRTSLFETQNQRRFRSPPVASG